MKSDMAMEHCMTAMFEASQRVGYSWYWPVFWLSKRTRYWVMVAPLFVGAVQLMTTLEAEIEISTGYIFDGTDAAKIETTAEFGPSP